MKILHRVLKKCIQLVNYEASASICYILHLSNVQFQNHVAIYTHEDNYVYICIFYVICQQIYLGISEYQVRYNFL